MKQIYYILFILVGSFLTGGQVLAQSGDALVRSGNRAYKQKQLDQSKQQYQKALQKNPQNPIAQYNLGNAEFRKGEFEDAAHSFGESIGHSEDKSVQEKGFYNKGVAEIRQKKLEESIGSWKNALKLDPADTEARENLQKALLELKAKQPPSPKQDQQDQKKQQEQPKPKPSKLNKQEVEQYLKSLEQQEKKVQEKMNQNKTRSLSQPDKDW